jgi:hypothetical protein
MEYLRTEETAKTSEAKRKIIIEHVYIYEGCTNSQQLITRIQTYRSPCKDSTVE